MGLDNGIHVKRKDGGAINDYDWQKYSDSYEVCYFRKYWSLRDRIVNYLNDTYGTDNDTYTWTLSIDDIDNIKDIINDMIVNVLQYDTPASTIWEQEIEVATMADAVKQLMFLTELCQDNWEDYIVYFYDSY